MRGRLTVACIALGVASAVASPLRGQIVPRRRAPPVAPQPRPPNAKGVRPDSTGKDSTATRPLVDWAQPDSVMDELMRREGVVVTRYQGDTVTFDAAHHAIRLDGDKSAVNRQQTTLVGATIVYNDSTQMVDARGDPVTLRDPSQNTADIIAKGRMTYDLANKTAAVTNIATSVESGQRWFIEGDRAAVVADTSAGKHDRLYALDGMITSCDDSVPDYYFHFHEAKVIAKNVLVARPAVLYLRDVPVLWLPFIFQDMRSGRRSGFLTPQFGVSELFRNSPTYRRHVQNLGYFFALSDYMDAKAWLDWRSGARPSPGDPGRSVYNGEWRYRWIDRFLSGQLAASYLSNNDGATSTLVYFQHQQDFSQHSHLNTSINYATSTTVLRNTTNDPYQAIANISSRINYQQQLGPANVSLGGDQTQHPGRTQIDRNFPNISLTPLGPLGIGSWLVWTPTLSLTNSQSLKIDALGQSNSYQFFTNGAGQLDSSRINGSSRRSSLSFGTPIKIFDFNWRNTFTVSDVENNYPQLFQLVNVRDTSMKSTRLFARNYRTDVDWQTGIDLPRLSQGRWNLVPSVSIVNVDPSAFWVRTQLTGSEYVHQSKRLQYALSASPTFFGLFPGFGPIARLRHSLTPSLSWSYSPPAKVSDAFLAALGRTRQGYLGALPQNQVTVHLSQNLEAKMRTATDTNPDAAPKIKLLVLDFDAITWDFERAKVAKSGITNSSFGYNLRSDLIPGFDYHTRYSLFQGSPLSDSALFKPYREETGASMSFSGTSPLVRAVGRLLGYRPTAAGAAGTSNAPPKQPPVDAGFQQAVAAQPVAGYNARNAMFNQAPGAGQGWQLSLTYSQSRQRPVIGGTVVNIDPRVVCNQYVPGTAAYAICIQNQLTSPGVSSPFDSTTAGAPIYRTPPTRNVQSSLSFSPTPKWTAQWQTTYDFEQKQFASHVVSLQRQLHDWRAIFAFTQAPNGNFAFHFFISLNANPDIKFDYDKQTYRPLSTLP